MLLLRWFVRTTSKDNLKKCILIQNNTRHTYRMNFTFNDMIFLTQSTSDHTYFVTKSQHAPGPDMMFTHIDHNTIMSSVQVPYYPTWFNIKYDCEGDYRSTRTDSWWTTLPAIYKSSYKSHRSGWDLLEHQAYDLPL